MKKLNRSETKVLIVDDNSEYRNVLARTLSREGYDVTEASDGRAAQGLLEAGHDFHAIISDIRMPGLSGLDLLYYVKNSFEIPFILITAFSELLETRDAFEIGADGFLCKPFESEELLSALAVALHTEDSDQKEPTNIDANFMEIDIKEFTKPTPTDVDLLFRLSASKYVKVASAGTSLDVDRVNSYIEKGVAQLYFKKN